MGRFFRNSMASPPAPGVPRPCPARHFGLFGNTSYFSGSTHKDRMEKLSKTVASANKTAYVMFIRAEASGHGRIVRTLSWSFA
jgi:hypothetical protein